MVATGSRRVAERRPVAGEQWGPPGVGGKGAKGMAGGQAAPRVQTVVTYVGFLGIWDAAPGKRLKFWDNKGTHVAAHPTRPVVAILESNGSGGVRLGLWDFAPDADRK